MIFEKNREKLKSVFYSLEKVLKLLQKIRVHVSVALYMLYFIVDVLFFQLYVLCI